MPGTNTPEPSVPDTSAAAGIDAELKALWDWNLTNHKPTAEAIKKIEALRTTAIAMKDAIIALSPHSRERSIALTNLEQVVFYAVAAVARQENEDVDDTPSEDKALREEKAKTAEEEHPPEPGAINGSEDSSSKKDEGSTDNG